MKPETCLLEYVLSSSLTNVDLNISEPSAHLRVSFCGSNYAGIGVFIPNGSIDFQNLCPPDSPRLEFNQSLVCIF